MHDQGSHFSPLLPDSQLSNVQDIMRFAWQKFKDAASTETNEHPSVQLSASTSETANLVDVPPLDDAAVSATIRKLCYRLLPFTALIVIVSYIDRGNLGFVASDVCTELNMNHSMYGLGVALFGLGYITSQIISNKLLRIFGAAKWFAAMLIVWGIVASSFSFVRTRTMFFVLRLILGIAEGGTFPGVWYYIAIFFPEEYTTYPYATLEAAMCISTPLAVPIAASLVSLDGVFFGVEGWRLLFFVEGCIPIIFGMILLTCLPSSLDQAMFLSQKEKTWLKSKHVEEDTPEADVWTELIVTSKDKRFWIIQFTSLVRGALLTAAFYWTTLIIDHMLNEHQEEDEDTCASSKSTSITSVLLTAVPFTISAVLSLVLGRVSDKWKNRPRYSGVIIATSGPFLYGWVLFRHISFPISLLCLSFAVTCFMAPNAMIVGLVAGLYDKQTKATALALFNTINGIGMTVGPLGVGLIVDNSGYGLAVTLLAASGLVGGLAMLAVKDPRMDAPKQFIEEPPGETKEDLESADNEAGSSHKL